MLEQLTNVVQATTLEGALFQVMMAYTEVVCMCNSNMSDRETAVVERRLNRLLYSVTAVLEREAGADCNDLGGDYYMGPERNHFAVLEAELKRASREEAN